MKDNNKNNVNVYLSKCNMY